MSGPLTKRDIRDVIDGAARDMGPDDCTRKSGLSSAEDLDAISIYEALGGEHDEEIGD